MNKKILFIILLVIGTIVLSLLPFSILKKKPINQTLLQIDSVLTRDPETALLKLNSINQKQLNKNDKFYYNLIKTQAEIELERYPADDSLINRSLFHFLSTGDSTIIARSFYLRGKYLQKTDNLLEAASSFINAAEYAPGNTNAKINYLISNALAEIYNSSRLYQYEIGVREKALDFAELYGDSSAITNSLLYLAKALSNTGTDSRTNINRILNLIYVIPDSYPEAIPELTKELAVNYQILNEPDSAIYYIDFALSLENDSSKRFSYYQIKGKLHQSLGEKEKAIRYYRMAAQSESKNDRLSAYEGLYEIYKQNRQPDTAFVYADKLINLHDSISRDWTKEALQKLNSIQSYKKQRKAYIENRFEVFRAKAMFLNISIVFLIVALILILITIFYRNRKIKLEISVKEEKSKLVEIELQKSEIENQLLREQRENYKRLNLISVPILSANRDKKGFIFLEQKDWDVILENTNICFEHFTERLIHDFPQLSKEDIQFLCLIKMELSLELLSAVYHIEKNSISKKKGRLRDKMGLDSKTLDEFIRLF